jgi:hypothetical protein
VFSSIFRLDDTAAGRVGGEQGVRGKLLYDSAALARLASL